MVHSTDSFFCWKDFYNCMDFLRSHLLYFLYKSSISSLHLSGLCPSIVSCLVLFSYLFLAAKFKDMLTFTQCCKNVTQLLTAVSRAVTLLSVSQVHLCFCHRTLEPWRNTVLPPVRSHSSASSSKEPSLQYAGTR